MPVKTIRKFQLQIHQKEEEKTQAKKKQGKSVRNPLASCALHPELGSNAIH